MSRLSERIAQAERELVDEAYDAIFDPAAWVRGVAALSDAVPEFYPLLRIETWRHSTIAPVEAGPWDFDLLARLEPDQLERNVFRPVIETMRFGEVTVTTDLVDVNTIVLSDTYADVLRHLGDIRSASGILLARDDRAFASLALHYEAKTLADGMSIGNGILRRVGRHLERAFALAQRGRALELGARARNVLEALPMAAIAIDRAGRFVRANALGDALLAERTVLTVGAGGSLAPVGETVHLGTAIARTLAMREPGRIRLPAEGAGATVDIVPLRRREPTHNIVDGFLSSETADAIVYVTLPESAGRGTED